MNDQELQALVDKWNNRHDMAREQFERYFQNMTRDQLIQAFGNQMSCDNEAEITGRIGLGPQSFNEFSLSAFAQEFKINFGGNILFAFSSNDLKPYAALSAASVGGGAQFIDVAVPQPFVSHAISTTDMLHYGIYLKYLSAEKCAIVCFDANGRQMNANDLSRVQYLNTSFGLRVQHRTGVDNFAIRPNILESLIENYAKFVSKRIYKSGFELLQNTEIKIIHTSLYGSVDQVFQRCVDLSGFSTFTYVEEERNTKQYSVYSFKGDRNQYLARAIQLAEANDAQIIIAHNSDGSRVLVAEREQTTNDHKVFTDEEIAILLLWWSLYLYNFKIEYKTRVKGEETLETELLLIDCKPDNNQLDVFALNRGITLQKFGNAIEAIDHLKAIDNNVIKPLFALGTNDLFLCDPTIICDWDGMLAAVHIAQLAIYLKAVTHTSLRNHLQSILTIYQ